MRGTPGSRPPATAPAAEASRRHQTGARGDRALAGIARRQAGVVSREQVLDAGLSARQISWRLRSGVWEALMPGVYLLASAEATLTSRRFAALLHCGPDAYLSHLSAAHLLGMDDRPGTGPIWVTVPHETRLRVGAGIKLRRTRVVPELLELPNGLVVSSPVRTLIDLAERTSSQRLTAMIHHAVFNRIVGVQDLLTAAAGPSRLPGFAAFRRAALSFDGDSDSGAEVEAESLFRAHGLNFTRQYEVRPRGGPRAVLDFADVGRRLGLEIDGAAHHAHPRAQERDRARDRWLTRMGWQILRITVADLRSKPDLVVEHVRAALAQREARQVAE